MQLALASIRNLNLIASKIYNNSLLTLNVIKTHEAIVFVLGSLHQKPSCFQPSINSSVSNKIGSNFLSERIFKNFDISL